MSGEDKQFTKPTHSYGTRFRHRLEARNVRLSSVDEGNDDDDEQQIPSFPDNPPNSPVDITEEEQVAPQEVGQSSSSVNSE